MGRAYGSEPILFDVSPVTNTLERRQKSRMLGWKKIALAIIGLLILSGGAGTVWLIWGRNAQISVIPQSVRQAVNFPLLEPQSLPVGFGVDSTSFQSTAAVVTYAITYANDKKLIVSEQPVPVDFDFETFYAQFEGRKDLISATGQTVLGRFEDADMASTVDHDTWVLIRAPYGIDATALESVVQSFSLVQN